MIASAQFAALSALFLLALLGQHTIAFTPCSSTTSCRSSSASGSSSQLMETVADTDKKNRSLSIPLSWNEMIRQVSSAMKEAAEQGQTRQIVRVLLPRDSTSGDFGKYLEQQSSEMDDNFSSVSLVPPDESWQGGILQLYRSAAPTAEKILQQLTANTAGGLPPRVSEDRSVDESGVDGVSFLKTEDNKVSCWLQPMQDNVDDIVDQAATNKDGIVFLLNPQWRLVDDALDTASKEEGFWGGLANFLGGKGGAVRQLQEAGFEPVYTFEGYVCRGNNVRLLQVLDSEWTVFCERDDGESFINVGTMPNRPTYQEVDAMLDKSDIGYKYERDFGMSPKL